MREMWQLPKPSAWSRVWPAVKVAALLWAVAALPLTIWLSQRTTPLLPPSAQRPLTVVEEAAVRYASQLLLTRPVTLTETVVTPLARLQVEQTSDAPRGVSHGTVRSEAQTAELLAVGGRVLLRGGAPFWAALGVPTAEPGWVEVGDRLGASLLFPVTQAAAALTPGPRALLYTAAGPAAPATFRNGPLTAVFGSDGLTTIALAHRIAAVAPPTGEALAALAASPAPGWDTAAALTGGKEALIVAPPATAPLPATATTTPTASSPDP